MAKDKEAEPQGGDRVASVLAAAWTAKLKKKFGVNVLTTASDAKGTVVQRLPSEIFALDYALGGGFAAGRVNVLYGMKSSGKTTILQKTLGSAQSRCANCFTKAIGGEKCQCGDYRESVVALLDVEGAYDRAWASKLGVNSSRVLYNRPEFAEQALDVAEALLRSQEVDVLAIDSIAFLSGLKELEESTEKDQVGTQARLLGKGIRKFVAALNWQANESSGRKTTVFLINQIRMKVGLMFGNPEVQPGGLAPGFAATTETLCRSGKFNVDEATGRPLYVDLHCRVEKNKVSPAKLECDIRLMLSDTETKKVGEFYDEEIVVKLAEQYGLLERQGKAGMITMLGRQFRTYDLVEQEMLKDREYFTLASNSLMSILLAQ